MTVIDHSALTITSRPENLSRVAEFIAEVAANFGMTDQETYNIQMAVDEAVTNIIEHAYEGDEGPIEIIAERHGDDFVVKLRDRGKPFDPDTVNEPDVSASLEDREIGGLGLYFMRRLMDEVTFHFSDAGWNELTMVRHRRAVATCPSRYDPTVWLIQPRGRLDANGNTYLEGELEALANDKHHRVVVDFQQVTYISSSGLRTLLLAVRRAKRHSGDVKLCSLSTPVRKIFRMAGFDMILDIHDNEEKAIKAFKK